MKRRSFFSLLAGIFTTILLVSLIGFAWLLAQSPLGLLKGAPDRTPAGAMFVPKQAPAMASLLVNPDRLVNLRQILARPDERRAARAELLQFQQGLWESSGLNYQTDIQPWLGNELTLAITTLDLDRDASNGAEPGYLLVMQTKDAERSRQFLQLFWQKQALAGVDLAFEQYQGAQLISSEPSSPQTSPVKQSSAAEGTAIVAPRALATAVVGKQFVLFANHPKVLRDAINTVQAKELGISSDPVYQRAIASLTAERIGLAVVNLPQLAALTGTSAKSIAPQAIYESVALSLGLDRQGLVAETALLPTPGKSMPTGNQPALTQPVAVLQYIPKTSLWAASGTNLAELWTNLNQGLVGYDALAQLINQPLQEWQTQWHLKLAEDIFPWVKGEYALGLVPQPEATGLDWIFVVDRTANPDAEQAIAHLDEIAKQQGLTAVKLELNNQAVMAWTRLAAKAKQRDLNLQAQVVAVHVTLGDYEVFTNTIAAMDQVLADPSQMLITDRAFVQTITPLLKPNYGYLYVDWAEGKAVLERQIPLLPVLELAGQPFFSHLQALSLSSYGNQEGIQRAGLFMRLD
jgi:Protein of unknown function (DUF3352)